MRFVVVTCLALVPNLSFAANPDCFEMGEIVNKIVGQRTEGTEMMAAMELVAADYSGESARFVPTIPPLTDWVYSLPDDQLTAEAGAAFETQCNAQ
ncbi:MULTISPECIES: hypothetical protein [unclassified Marinovum]